MKTKTALMVWVSTCLLVVSATAQVTVTSVLTNGLAEPYNVVVDAANNLFISDSANNQIVRIDASTQEATTLAGIPYDLPGTNDGPAYLAHFNNPEGLLVVTLGGNDGLLVTDNANHLLRFVRFSDGFVTTIAGQVGGGSAVNAAGLNATFRYPLGLDQDSDGNVYIVDWGNNVIRVMNLNDPAFGVTNIIVSDTTFFRPTAVAFAGTNGLGAKQIWVADTGNQQIKLITLSSATTGSLTTVLGGFRTTGTADSTFGANARFNVPSGLLWFSGVGLLISDTANNTVRLATNYPAFGPTNYAVKTFAGTPGQAGLLDGNALSAKFNSPYGLARDIANNGLLVADLKNNAIRRIQTGPPLPPVPAPQIGWVDLIIDPFGNIFTVLRTNQPFTFHNDVTIAIAGTDGTETFFTFGATPSNPLVDTIPNPSPTSGSSPPFYRDGAILSLSDLPPTLVPPQPDLTIKAIGTQAGRQNSPIVSARFQFRTATPNIIGDNAAQFLVSDETTSAQMWYTIDGSDPTNSAPSLGPITGTSDSPATLSLGGSADITFKVRAFRDNYANSAIATRVFSPSNFVPNRITFGFSSGEASSDFQGAPGQYFYAPVTMSVLPGATMYSLQFNVTVTNAPGTPASRSVEPGALGFTSSLMRQVPNFAGDHLPPDTQQWYNSIPPAFGAFDTNLVCTIGSLIFTNSSINLLGVGWAERWGFQCLYNTLIQDVISYSIAHDTLFIKGNGRVVVGAYAFKVPTNALPGDKYRIQIGRPSATSDGVGAPGADVFIDTPTNATADVTVNPRPYLVGDVAPFRWFNAGDFGNGCLLNDDVVQVYQTAVYGMDPPPPLSDFNASMDSCCGTAGSVSGGIYYQQGGTTTPFNTAVFDGDDTTINTFPFGDGQLDVTDIYVTFRRSLDPSLTWWQRFWTTSGLAAQVVPNTYCHSNTMSSLSKVTTSSVNKLDIGSSESPSVNFAAGDAIASANQTLTIPITAQIHGNYPIRVLALGITVQPLDGSPALTQQIQFTPAAALGAPGLAGSKHVAHYGAAWLNSGITGLSGNATVGTLTIQVPSGASSSSAYAIHFDHASASPNGLASFPKQTQTGLITLSDRSMSSYGDGIPDSWRLRYFGTANNLLSQASADADGDGATNWREYVAGTDPTDPKSCLRVSNSKAAQDYVIRWPSVTGKHYVIERSSSVFAASWTPISTNTGTGGDMEYHDSPSGSRFYRVRVQ